MGSEVYSSLHENCYHKLYMQSLLLQHCLKVGKQVLVTVYHECCIDNVVATSKWRRGIHNFLAASILERQTHNVTTMLYQR